MDLHPDERIVFEGHPSWRAVLSFYIGGVGGALVIAAILWFAVGAAVSVLVFAVLVAIVVVAGLIKRTATDYMVTNQRLYIRRGILSKKIQQTRIDRVQNVNTEQRFRDRLLRVGTVDFDTAGSDDSEFRFVGISDPTGSRASSTRCSAPRRRPRRRSAPRKARGRAPARGRGRRTAPPDRPARRARSSVPRSRAPCAAQRPRQVHRGGRRR